MLIGFIRHNTGRHCGLLSKWRLTFASTKGETLLILFRGA